MQDQQQEEINTTRRWGVGLLIGIILQTLALAAAGAWWGSAISSQVDQNTTDINKLQVQTLNINGIFLTREQVEDLLAGRDARLTSMEKTMERIERKLDKAVQ